MCEIRKCDMNMDDMNMDDTDDGVFAPICTPMCNPEVCEVPRIPYYQDLVKGKGKICNLNCKSGSDPVTFRLHIYREMFDVFGELMLMDAVGNSLVCSRRLEAYHSPTEESMIAIFHFEDPKTGHSRELSVSATATTDKKKAKLYVYGAPLVDCELHFGGCVMDGCIKIEKSQVDHDH